MKRTSHRAVFLVGLLLTIALGACSSASVAPDQPPHYAHTLDLSHVVREDVPYLPHEPRTRLLRDPQGRLVQVTLGMQTGSLLRVAAAPGAELSNVEALSPRDLVLPAAVIDARDLVQDRPDFVLTPADVLAWERSYGLVPQGSLVLLVTGWDLHWGDPARYLNPGPDGQPRTPGYGLEAADLLLNQRGAAGLGLDAPGQNHQPAHGFALMLENLTSLEQLPATGATVVIGALKLQQAYSSPARVLALLPE